MDVRFEIDDFGDETAAAQAVAQGLAPEEPEHLWGKIVLAHGSHTLELADDLLNLGLALCVRVPQALAREGRATLAMVSWGGRYEWAVDQDEVQVSGPSDARFLFPREPLLAALHACGQRLSAWMGELSVASPQYRFSAQTLASRLAAPAEGAS